MGAMTLQTISKELMLACRSLGYTISEALAALVASTIINPNNGSFYVERPIDENDAILLIAEAAKRIQSKEPTSRTMRLQADYEEAFAEHERTASSQKSSSKSIEDKVLYYISNFTARFDEDFDRLTGLYKKIFQFLLLRCAGPQSALSPPKDPAVEKEVAAALESVFPRVGLRSFVALTGAEKAAQMQELAGIVLGIRLFNKHQRKGGSGLPTVEDEVERLNATDLFHAVQREAEEVTDICQRFQDVILVSTRRPPSGAPGWQAPAQAELDKARGDLLYHRQYLCYLMNLQEDLAGCIERLAKDQKTLSEELVDLEALVGGRVSVPKEQVYPRFDSVAQSYRAAWAELRSLDTRKKLHTVLQEARKTHFPAMADSLRDILKLAKASKTSTALGDEEEDAADLDSIPGPDAGQDMNMAIRLTVENSADFLSVPLDFQGFCVHTLVTQERLLVPGNPALGVIKYAGRYCVFATERACVEFCAAPDKFFSEVRDTCYRYPELIHLLRVNEDFPRSSLHGILQATGGSGSVMKADIGTETPMHFVESNIDPKYEWNEWQLRRDALHMADICKKKTSATQTVMSHLRREGETQVYLPRDVATNTAVTRGTNPPRWKRYVTGMRGEPELKMKVAELKFDL
eukprot:TRINITY_DN31524_c0_g1_i1.p1 TRINITY_DN31524_c0_g1~~TRINITY_DN31524_c0_g1_i1.p1  ORF type:complete len:676 (-),score=159.20 TRINITY_DN31524_c0_g1_i1:134-2038(-)